MGTDGHTEVPGTPCFICNNYLSKHTVILEKKIQGLPIVYVQLQIIKKKCGKVGRTNVDGRCRTLAEPSSRARLTRGSSGEGGVEEEEDDG